mmetsp:Transcript_9633/g.22133  ORF Transcript_9633/g.22133 Transcript_9633/m.22133 type:complete len:534 (+) Transcript_9633:71-1672(+)
MRRSIDSDAMVGMGTLSSEDKNPAAPEDRFLYKAMAAVETKLHSMWAGKKAAQQKSVEEQKMDDMANIILTYRGLADEDDEIIEEKLVWCDRAAFDVFMSLVIIINTVVIGLETDIGSGSDGREWYWILFECIFMLIFVGEIGVKVYYHTYQWILEDFLNLFTTVVAFMAFIDFSIMQPLGSGGDLRVVSLFRIIGLVRLLRLIRKFKSLEELQLVLAGLVESSKTLIWTVLLMIMLIYICAVFLTKQIGHNVDVYGDYRKLSGGWDHEEFFGTVGRSMYTLLQCMTLDSWSSRIARHVMANQVYMLFFFMLFLILSTFGIMNIIVAVIVEQMLTASQNNEKKTRIREERAKKAELDMLKDIFDRSDADGNGRLELHEYNAAVKDPEVQWRMRHLELPIADAAKLFSVIDGDGSRELSIEEFIAGCNKLKGVAQSKDLLGIQSQADTLGQRMDTLNDSLADGERMLAALDEVTLRIARRFDSALEGSRRKLARSVGGSKPMVQPQKKERAKGDLVALSIGNRPALPVFPDLLG